MATYTRLGSYLLASELTNDPIGRVHRGIVLVGDKFDHHVLVRTFFEELNQAGLAAKLPDGAKNVPALGGSKAFGVGYRFEGGAQPFVVCDYVPGRTLAQLLAKAKHEQIPFGVDHALSVMQGIAQSLIQMHAKGLPHGLLSPHSVWVSFEGATQILDAPYAGQLKALLPKAPITQSSLEAYVRDSAGSALQADFFSLGAILYEMLTLDRLPMANLGSTLVGATLKAAQEETPIPKEILNLLQRLLGVGDPFGSAQEFNAEMERVLYDGDYSPTTFNMAFFMHTLFREENDGDGHGIKNEANDDYSAYVMVAAEAAAGGRQREPLVAGESEAQKSKKIMFIGGGAAVVIIAGLVAMVNRKDPEKERLQAQIVELQRKQVQLDQERAEQDKKANDAKEAQRQLEAQKREAKSAAEAERIQQKIDEEKKKEADALKKKAEVSERARQHEKEAVAVAQQIGKPELKPEVKPEPKPAAPAPTPAPAAPTPTPAAPTPAPSAPTPTPTPAASAPVQETPVQVTNRKAPGIPANARDFLRNAQQEVQLKVFVDVAGRPQKVVIVKGGDGPFGPAFNQSAEKAALDSSYQPATRDGKPVSGWITLSYVFRR